VDACYESRILVHFLAATPVKEVFVVPEEEKRSSQFDEVG
jgi:hypothetical protein